MDMTKTIIFINNYKDVDSIVTNDLTESKIFSLNIEAHKYLEKRNLSHEIGETYLSENERIKLFDRSVDLHNWYEKNKELNFFEFENINLLGLMDTVEFHTFLINELITFFTIKNIIENEKPTIIFASENLSEIMKLLLINNMECNFFPTSSSQKLHWDEITIKQNIGRLPISFNISRKTFVKIKSIWEKIACSFFNLWFNFKNSDQKTILFLEFYPPLYEKLLYNLQNNGYNIIFLNQRKPAVFDYKSIKLLKKINGKIINSNTLIDSNEKNQIQLITNNFLEKIQSLFSKEHIFDNIFTFDNYDLWKLIKNKLLETYKNRLYDYVFLVFYSKNLFQKINISCILTLNEVGETEKSILASNNNKIPTILLEHGFSNFSSESARFGILANYSNFNDKIAVWSEKQKNFLIDFCKIDSSRIIVSGSPRHDYLFENNSIKNNVKNKTVLIAPTPITQIQGFDTTDIHIKYELTLKQILMTLKKLNCNIVIKLHPSQNTHNEMIKNLVSQIDKKIPIHLLSPINELIEMSDIVITITPESWAPSTVILESLIQNRPIINITLDNHIQEFDFIKSESILSVSNYSDIEKVISNLILDQKLQNKLIKNGQKFIKTFLHNPGLSSDTLVTKIKSIEESNNNKGKN
jgi:hypothetical protein